MTEKPHLISVIIDSSAAPELAPELHAEESEESRSGVKYFGPGDKNGPTLVDRGRRRYTVKVVGMKRILKAHVVPVRRPLLPVCDLLATGHDVHFTAEGSWAEHRKTGDVITLFDAVGNSRLKWKCSPESVGKRFGASFGVDPTEGAGVPLRKGAQRGFPRWGAATQHQAAAEGGGVIPLMASGLLTAAERASVLADPCAQILQRQMGEESRRQARRS